MLSPIITTSGNLNFGYHSASWRPMSYCSRSPVPLSPITAKCSESDLLGSGTCAAGWAPRGGAETTTEESDGDGLAVQQISPARQSTHVAACGRRGIILTLSLLEGLRHPVRNDVRVGIEQDEVLSHESVLELLGQLRKVLQHLRGNGRDLYLVGIASVRRQDEAALVFVVHDLRAHVRTGRAAKHGQQQAPYQRLHARIEEVSLLGALAGCLD